jgi:hypothetical protein
VKPARQTYGRKSWRDRRYVLTGHNCEAGQFYRGRDLRGVGCPQHRLLVRLNDRPGR